MLKKIRAYKNAVVKTTGTAAAAGASTTAAMAAEPSGTAAVAGITASSTPYLIAFAAGAVLGAGICYAGYRHYKSKNPGQEGLFQDLSNKNLKSFNELLTVREHISTLDAASLKSWFSDNHVENEDVKLMIAIPNEQVLAAVGYSVDGSEEIDFSKYIIQSIYSSSTGGIYKLRFINFDSIDSKLQERLLEQDGLIILND